MYALYGFSSTMSRRWGGAGVADRARERALRVVGGTEEERGGGGTLDAREPGR